MLNIQEELKHSLKLLKKEWKEDLEQFKKKFLYTSIPERKSEGICWYPVQLKKSKNAFGDKLIVELERMDPKQSHAFQSGKSVSIFSGLDEYNSTDNRLNGVINFVKKEVMTVTLPIEELPIWLEKTKIGIDLLFDEGSYREMEAALKATLQAEKGRLGELKNILLGQTNANFNVIPVPILAHLNTSQNEALQLISNAQDVSVIHGPPGTGKTTTLIASVLQTLENQKQVLVCAPSNAAVDYLVEKLIERNVNTIRIGHPARVDEHILSQTLDAKIAQHDSFKDLKRLKKSAESLRKMGQKHKRSFGPEERRQRQRLFDEANRCREDAESLEKYITYDLFQQAQVIACTLVGSASYALKGMKFPIVFIDEAGQGLEAATWIAILRAEKVVMAGGHCQLPPTIKSYEAAKEGLSVTLFEKVIERQPEASKMLRTQYRMPELLMGFSSDYFYNNELEAAENTKTHYLAEDEQVLEFIDTAGSGFNEQVEEESLSTFNLEEARFALGYLEKLFKRIGIATCKSNNWTIGVIAPYRAQVRRLNELVFETYEYPNVRSLAENLTIDSIDGFQGQERDIMLISLVRSNASGEIGFLSDTRRMNVALTRAKRKLIVIGDSATLSTNTFYNDYLDYVEKHGAYRSVYDYLDY